MKKLLKNKIIFISLLFLLLLITYCSIIIVFDSHFIFNSYNMQAFLYIRMGLLHLFAFITCWLIISHIYTKKRLTKMAYIDPLTGDYNKTKFYWDCKEIIETNKDGDYAIVTLDIDNFKTFNNTFGFTFGDKVLIEISNILRQNLTNTDRFCHITADIFAICIRIDNNRTFLQQKIEKINQDIRLITIDSIAVEPNVWFGIYVLSDNCTDIRICIDNANLTRKFLKHDHKKQFAFYTEQLQTSIIESQQIQSDLEKALIENQLEVYYQPQIYFDSKKFAGMEALVRWKHPQKGFISPTTFIPIAEKSGQICKIGYFIFEQVCKDLDKWNKEGHNFTVAVNLSRAELYQSDYMNKIGNLLSKYKINSNQIHLELTETTAINDLDYIKKMIVKLKSNGFLVAMDDFGTGYSSLSCLKSIPFDILKLDRSFLQGLTTNEKAETIIELVVKLAKLLNYEVIAEGVETKQESDFLTSVGCDIAQGYYYAKPMSKQDFEKFILNYN